MKPIITYLVLATVTGFWLSGCTTSMSRQITSLNVGCNTDEVKISDYFVDLNSTENWTAECDGKKYSCSYLPESGSDCYEISE